MNRAPHAVPHTRQPSRPARCPQKGIGLLEAIAFIAVSSLVAGGSLAMYSSASDTEATVQAASEITTIKGGVKGLYPNGTYGAANLNGVLIDANKLPSTLTVPSYPTIRNHWDGDVVVQGQTTSYYVSYDKVPNAICVAALISVMETGQWIGFNVTASGNPVGGMATVAMTPAAAKNYCGSGASSKKLTFWAK